MGTTTSGKQDQINALAYAAADCHLCDLDAHRTQVVFGEGNVETPLVIIGEGPGEQEDKLGRPFVGRAGALLDKVLLEHGITRQHIYITNIVRCRPVTIENGKFRNRPPRPVEANACKHWTDPAIDIIKPVVILCLGVHSANVIIHPDFKITKERGIWFESPYAPHAMAAFHPAYILRQTGTNYDTAIESLKRDIGEAKRKIRELRKTSELK